jgi:hypothetical protein
MAINFNPYRKTGGTIEVVRDAQGNYTTKEVGFDTVSSLSLPDLGTVATTATAQATKTAADLTDSTVTDQTKQAFLIPKKDDKDDITLLTPDDLNRQATDLSRDLSDVRTATTIQDSIPRSERIFRSDTQRFKEEFDPTRIESPTERVFGRSTLEDEQRERQTFLPETKLEKPSLTLSAAEAEKRKPKFLSQLFSRPEKATETIGRLPSQTKTYDQLAAEYQQKALDREEMITGATPDDEAANVLGISTEPSATRLAKETDFASGILGTRVPDAIREGQPAAPEKLKTNALTTLRDSISSSPTLTALGAGAKLAATTMSRGLDAVFGVSPAERSYRNTTSAVLKSSGYKTRNELGSSTDPDRIAMSPQDSVFGGMNRSGNTIKGANKRISTRTTVGQARVEKRYGKDSKQAQDFKAKTEKFKAELEAEQAKVNKATMNQGPPSQSGGGNKGGGKIVCTMMNESYGFGSFRNKIWLRQSKNLAPEYQIGYHKLFLPLVNYAKQKGITNNIVKKILEHIAIHRTIDIRQEEKNKIHLIGRVYRKILEPLCYWAGKK